MFFTRVVRQFHRGDGALVTLHQDFAFPAAPTVGTRLQLASVGRPLTVVSILMRPRSIAELGVLQPALVVSTEWEAVEDAEAARASGWLDLPQPAEPRP